MRIRNFAVVLLFAALSLPGQSIAGYQLVWSDEFNGPNVSAPDPTKWAYDTGTGPPFPGWGNNALETYTSSPGNVFLDGNGHLVIRALSTSGGYTSGRIKTQTKFSFTYGIVEARIRIPYAQGIWPAFWMLGASYPTVPWPDCGEIDIMENFGVHNNDASVNHGTLHGPGDTGAGISGSYTLPNGQKFADDFHVFAVQWTPGGVQFSVDGNSYLNVTSASMPAGWQSALSNPFFPLLNVAVGGSPAPVGNPDATTAFPQQMLVDYVRVYQLAGTGTAPAAVTPGSGAGLGQTMTFTFTDPRGYQDLDVVNVLIDNFLDGRQSCYLAYSLPSNVVYLVNDPGTALLPGLPMGSTGNVGNSQCIVNGPGSSAAGSGNTLTVTLNMTFNASFAGNKVTYLAARDLQGGNSGWQPMGTWGVPGAAAFPAVGGVSPAGGMGSNQIFTFTFSDTKGWQDLGIVNVLINNALDGRQSCYLAYGEVYYGSNARLYLVNDAGTSLVIPALALDGSGPATLGNSQCTVTAAGSSVAANGNTLTLTLNLSFCGTFAGNRIIYMAARDATDANNSGWQSMGAWSVQ